MGTNLESSFNKILPIPDSIIESFFQKKEELIESVNDKLHKQKKKDNLLNGCPMRLIYDNQINFHSILFNTLLLKDPKILLNHLDWEYKTYHAQGVLYDFFITRAFLWQDSVKELIQEGKLLEPVFQWFITHHDTIVNSSERKEYDEDHDELVNQFYTTLLRGDHKRCEEICKQKIDVDGATLEDVYCNIIKPAMYRIGNEWEKGKITVEQEHLASAISTKVTTNIYASYEKKKQKEGKIVVATPAKENHALGALMVANAVEIAGYNVTYLSQKASEEQILETLQNETPEILCLSISMANNILRARTLIQKIRAIESLKDIKIMVGGYILTINSNISETLDCDMTISNIPDAVVQIDRWMGI